MSKPAVSKNVMRAYSVMVMVVCLNLDINTIFQLTI